MSSKNVYGDTRVCSSCKKPYPNTPDYFARHGVRKDGTAHLRSKCFACTRAENYQRYHGEQVDTEQSTTPVKPLRKRRSRDSASPKQPAIVASVQDAPVGEKMLIIDEYCGVVREVVLIVQQEIPLSHWRSKGAQTALANDYRQRGYRITRIRKGA